MPYSAKAIANYFLDLAKTDKKDLDPMKIQKLVYFAHGWCLAFTGNPLITDKIEAWKYGPVIRSLYDSFKGTGSRPIEEKAADVRFINKKMVFIVPSIEEETCELLDKDFVKDLLREVWRVYGKYSAIQLSNFTHEAGSPWDLTIKSRGENAIIEDKLMKDKFEETQERAK